MCVHIFSSVWVAKWPSFGKKLLTGLTMCSLCILTCNFSYFPICFERWIWVVIASVPGILFTFIFSERSIEANL